MSSVDLVTPTLMDIIVGEVVCDVLQEYGHDGDG